MATHLIFKKVHSMLVSELAAIYQFKNENTKFKVALRK
jgi:hypothetical protein